jgi:hypothetical protein
MEKIQKKIEKFVPDQKNEDDSPKAFILESARDFAKFSINIQ